MIKFDWFKEDRYSRSSHPMPVKLPYQVESAAFRSPTWYDKEESKLISCDVILDDY
jgi:hypothetical protein